jgi:hypothetical protein
MQHMPVTRQPWVPVSMPREATEGLGIDTGWRRVGLCAGHGKEASKPAYEGKNSTEYIEEISQGAVTKPGIQEHHSGAMICSNTPHAVATDGSKKKRPAHAYRTD